MCELLSYPQWQSLKRPRAAFPEEQANPAGHNSCPFLQKHFLMTLKQPLLLPICCHPWCCHGSSSCWHIPALGSCPSSMPVLLPAMGSAMGAAFTSLQPISNSLVLTGFLNISADGSFISSAPSFRNAGCIPSAPGVLGSLCTVSFLQLFLGESLVCFSISSSSLENESRVTNFWGWLVGQHGSYLLNLVFCFQMVRKHWLQNFI